MSRSGLGYVGGRDRGLARRSGPGGCPRLCAQGRGVRPCLGSLGGSGRGPSTLRRSCLLAPPLGRVAGASSHGRAVTGVSPVWRTRALFGVPSATWLSAGPTSRGRHNRCLKKSTNYWCFSSSFSFFSSFFFSRSISSFNSRVRYDLRGRERPGRASRARRRPPARAAGVWVEGVRAGSAPAGRYPRLRPQARNGGGRGSFARFLDSFRPRLRGSTVVSEGEAALGESTRTPALAEGILA